MLIMILESNYKLPFLIAPLFSEKYERMSIWVSSAFGYHHHVVV